MAITVSNLSIKKAAGLRAGILANFNETLEGVGVVVFRMLEYLSGNMTRGHMLLGLCPDWVLVPVAAELVECSLDQGIKDPVKQGPVEIEEQVNMNIGMRLLTREKRHAAGIYDGLFPEE